MGSLCLFHIKLQEVKSSVESVPFILAPLGLFASGISSVNVELSELLSGGIRGGVRWFRLQGGYDGGKRGLACMKSQ